MTVMIEKIKENKALTEPACWQKSTPKYRGWIGKDGVGKVTVAMTLMN